MAMGRCTAFIAVLSLLAMLATADVFEEGPAVRPSTAEPLEFLEAGTELTDSLIETGPVDGLLKEDEVVRGPMEFDPTPVSMEEGEIASDDEDEVLSEQLGSALIEQELLPEEDLDLDKESLGDTKEYLKAKLENAVKLHNKLALELKAAREEVKKTRGENDEAKAAMRTAQRKFEKAQAVLNEAVKDCNRDLAIQKRESELVKVMIKMIGDLHGIKASADQLMDIQMAAKEILVNLDSDSEEGRMINDLSEGRLHGESKRILELLKDLEKKLTSHKCSAEVEQLSKTFAVKAKVKETTESKETNTRRVLEKSIVKRDQIEAKETQARKEKQDLKDTLERVQESGDAKCKLNDLKESRDEWRKKAHDLSKMLNHKRACPEDMAEDVGDWKDKNDGKFEKLRKNYKEQFAATYENWDFFKFKVDGVMNGPNLVKTCKAKGMMTPCDHVAYNDGHCVPVFFQGHLSYNNHHRFPRKAIKDTYFYAKQGRTLFNNGMSHRWSNNNDKDGMTMCVVPAQFPRTILKWNNWRFYKVRIAGQINSANMAKTCKDHGLYTPCCHSSWADGKCVAVNHHGYMSYNNHHDFPRNAIDWTYWYSANAHRGRALQNWHNTHRWNIPNERDGEMFCVAPAKRPDPNKVIATWNGFKFHKVHVNGLINSANIHQACKNAGYLTVCGHRAYADGKCIVVNDDGHMSYNKHHDFNRELVDRVYFYCGKANRGKALQNWRNTHRWSSAGDMFGDTFCVEQPQPKRSWATEVQFKLNGYEFYKTMVEGQVNKDAILKACKAINLQVPCDHPAYADGNCVSVMKRGLHLSYNPHHSLPRNKIDGCFFYAGSRHQNRALENWRNTHRWSTNGDMFVPTMCVRPPPPPNPKAIVAKWKGWSWHKVRIEGAAMDANLLKTCAKYGYKTPCDHKAYQDGKCTWVGNNGHMSYNPHHNFDRKVIANTYWYARKANRGFTLENWSNTHRWSAKGDFDGDTLCISKRTSEELEQDMEEQEEKKGVPETEEQQEEDILEKKDREQEKKDAADAADEFPEEVQIN